MTFDSSSGASALDMELSTDEAIAYGFRVDFRLCFWGGTGAAATRFDVRARSVSKRRCLCRTADLAKRRFGKRCARVTAVSGSLGRASEMAQFAVEEPKVRRKAKPPEAGRRPRR